MTVLSIQQYHLGKVIKRFRKALAVDDVDHLVDIDMEMCDLMAAVSNDEAADQELYAEQVKQVLQMYQIILNNYETDYNHSFC